MTHDDWSHDIAQWVRLEQTPGVGIESARRLLAAFGLPEKIFTAGFSALKTLVPDRVAHALSAPPADAIKAQIEKTLVWAQQRGNRVLTLADPHYPKALLDIADPPLMLYVKGRIDLLSSAAIAVVGSRNATAQGTLNAEKFSESLSRAGLTIVSGMALGIDAAAHRGGLRGSGSTVAVIGTGIDIVYPSRNHALAHEVAQVGCIVSEYALGTPALPPNFPRRNRIISGLSRGVLVIEAAAQSGSLITARMAGDQGRDVFAIPGSIHSPLSKGCHLLIKQGAKLVESAQDILEELRLPAAVPAPFPSPVPRAAATLPLHAGGEHAPILAAMGFDPVSPDELALRCNIDMPQLSAQLLMLELDGMVEMLPGGLVRRLATP